MITLKVHHHQVQEGREAVWGPTCQMKSIDEFLVKSQEELIMIQLVMIGTIESEK